MKNLNLEWSKEKVDAMARTRGPVKGVVSVLVLSKLGSEYEYGTVTTGVSEGKIASTLPPSVGIYAVMPSSNPEDISSHILSLWDDPDLAAAPYTLESDGVVFRKGTPDHFLNDMRTWAWRLSAEQNPVEIVECWGCALEGERKQMTSRSMQSGFVV